MPKLGLGTGFSRSGLVTPGVVTDSLVMKHMYPKGAVQKLNDGSAYFNSSTPDYILLNDFTLDTDVNCCIMFWWKYNGAGSSPWTIFGHTPTGNRHLRFVGSNRLTLESNTADNEGLMLLHTAFTDNEWHHYAVVCTSGTLTAFQDGVSLLITNASGGTFNGMNDDTTFRYIGAQDGDADVNNLDGYLCNLGVWSRACTQAEIKSIMFKKYADLTTSEKTSLVSFWNLDEVYSSSDGDTNIVFDNYHNGGESLGSEMAIDGNFDNNGASWTTDANHNTTVTISNNAVTMTNDGTTGYGSVQQASTDFIDGTWYKLTFDVTAITTSNNIAVYNYNSDLTKALDLTNTPATVTDYFLASNTDGIDVRATLENGESITIDNISVKKVNGNAGELK